MTVADPSVYPARLPSGTDARDAASRFTVRRHHDATVIGVSGQVDAAKVASRARVLAQFLRVDLDFSELAFPIAYSPTPFDNPADTSSSRLPANGKQAPL